MKSNPYHFPITRCPNCGCDTIVIKQYICGYGEYRVNMETGEVDCSEIYDSLLHRNARKYVTCLDCGRRLFKIKDSLEIEGSYDKIGTDLTGD